MGAVGRTSRRRTPAPLPWAPTPHGPTPHGRPAADPRPRPRRVATVARIVGGPAGRGRALLLTAAAALVVAVAVGLSLLTGGRTVSTPFLSYTVPDGWTADPADAAPQGTPVLQGAAHGPGYDCGGERYVRGFAAAALLPTDASAGPADRAERLARWFAASSYSTPDGAAPEVTVAPPRPVQVAGPQGLVDGTVTELTAGAAGHGDCPGLRGTVLVLAAPVSGGAALLLVAGDADGGPPEPRPPARAALDGVLASVRLA